MKKATIQVIKPNSNFDLLSQKISRNYKLSDGAIRLYLYLNSLNENFYISYNQITHNMRKSENYIYRNIKELKKAGLIEIEKSNNNFIYKLYCEPRNEEYKIIELIDNNQLNYGDFKIISQILENKRITKETRQRIYDKLQKILKKNLYE